MNLNAKQILAIAIAVLSVLAASTAQLTDLFGPSYAKYIVSMANLLTGIMASVVAVLSAQGAMVRDVAAMPGVERVAVNALANPTLAQVATDPLQPKVGAITPEVREVLKETAKGTTI